MKEKFSLDFKQQAKNADAVSQSTARSSQEGTKRGGRRKQTYLHDHRRETLEEYLESLGRT